MTVLIMEEKIRIVGYAQVPFMTNCFHLYPKACPDPGVEVALLYHVLSAVGFHIQWIKVSDLNAALALIQEGSADMTAWTDTTDRNENYISEQLNLSQTITVTGDELCCVYPTYRLAAVDSSVLNVWSKPVWIAAIMTYAAAYVTIWILRKISKRNRLTQHANTTLDITLGIIVNIFLSVFGNLLSIELFGQEYVLKRPFQSQNLSDLADNLILGNCRLAANQYSMKQFWFMFPLSYNNSDVLKSLNTDVNIWLDKFRIAETINPPLCTDGWSVDEQLRLLGKKNPKVIPIIVLEKTLAKSLRKRAGQTIQLDCMENVHSVPYSYFYRAKSKQFRSLIDLAFSAGSLEDLYERLLLRSTSPPKRIADAKVELDTERDDFMERAITWRQTDEILYILLLGCLAGLLMLLLEFYRYRTRNFMLMQLGKSVSRVMGVKTIHQQSSSVKKPGLSIY